jgi:hypothetical protein
MTLLDDVSLSIRGEWARQDDDEWIIKLDEVRLNVNIYVEQVDRKGVWNIVNSEGSVDCQCPVA